MKPSHPILAAVDRHRAMIFPIACIGLLMVLLVPLPRAVLDILLVLKNTGATAWRKGTQQDARLGVRGNDTGLAFLDDAWPTTDRPAAQAEDLVLPGGTATFTFSVAGARPGRFDLPLRGVIDGGAWMDDLGVYVPVTVLPPKPVKRPHEPCEGRGASGCPRG